MSATHPSSLREAFVQHLIVTQRKQRTIDTYVNAVTQFYHFLNCKHPLQVSANDIRAFLFHLVHERKYKPRTYNQYFYGLKAFYETFMPDVPIMASFSRQSTPDGAITIISRFDFDRILQHTHNIKHKAVLSLLYSSGIRSSECVSIRVENFDTRQMLIRVTGKGNKTRHTIFSTRCRQILREYVKQTKVKDVLFPGRNKEHISKEMVGHIVRDSAKRVGIKQRVSPHILRHSFATHFLEIDGRLPVLQALLGHEHPKTTFRYCHVETSMIRTAVSPLDVQIERFGPRPAQGGKQ
jgi:site-specific recombinase XerD